MDIKRLDANSEIRKNDTQQRIDPPRFRPREAVVCGDIRWKPIDRTAALVVARAPWWAAPQETTPKITKTMKNQCTGSSPLGKPHAAQDPNRPIISDKSNDEFNSSVHSNIIKGTRSSIDSANELLEKSLDARAALDIMSDQWLRSWMDFLETTDKRIHELRLRRMAFDAETRPLMASLRDVRSFFFDDKHQEEVRRLGEFVDLCERLQKLKASGFLDVVADTMLKLS